MSKSPINVEVYPRKNEAIERTLRRFTKKIKKEGILDKVREKLYYEKPSDEKRRMAKKRKGVLRRLKQKQETN